MSARRYGSERDWRADHSSFLPPGSVRSEQEGYGRNSGSPLSYRYNLHGSGLGRNSDSASYYRYIPHGSVNNPLPGPSRTRGGEELEQNRHVSAVNWSVCPVLTDTGRFYDMGWSRQREFDMQYKEGSSSSTSHLEKLSQLCESLSRGKPTLNSKFQWHNLLEPDMIQGNGHDSAVDMVDGSVAMPVESPCKRTRRFVGERSSHVDMIEGDMVRVRDDAREYRVLDNQGSCVKENVYLVEHQHYGDGLDRRDDHLKYKREVALDHVNLKVVEDSGFHREPYGLGGVGNGHDSAVDMVDGSVGDVGKTMPLESPCERARRFVGERSSHVDMIEEGNMVRVRDDAREYRVLDNHGCVKENVHLVEHQYYGEGGDGFDYRSDHLKYKREVDSDHVNLKAVEDSGFHRESYGLRGVGAYEDSFRRLPVSYHEYSNEINPQWLSTAKDQGIPETSEMVLKRKRNIDSEMSYRECSKPAMYEINGLSYDDAKWTNQYLEPFSSSETLELRHSNFHPSVKQRLELAETSTKSLTPRRSVMQRLELAETAPNTRSVMQRLEPAETATNTRSVKQRLGHATDVGNILKPDKNANHKLPWIRRLEERSKVSGLNGTLNSQAVESLRTKAKLPEESDEFMQQVQKSFLKFFKLLNENRAERYKYEYPKGNSALKCGACGSDSKEFVDTLGLAQHASACKKWFRTEHLGLHKALCALMGWKNVVDPDRSWVRELLTPAEALAQKEDLIIWPPVVIIQNSSMSNKNPDERIPVGVEDLRNLIRAMGFSQTNLCRGRAENLRIMVVNFTGTFSGLREAERLHKRFSLNKHGRADLVEVRCRSGQTGIAEGPESILYGYLGLARDLDELDIATKRRSVVRSKKAIDAVAEASFEAQ